MNDWHIRPADIDDAAHFCRVEDDAAALLRNDPSLAGVTIPPPRTLAQYSEIISQKCSLAAVADTALVGIAAARPFGDELHLHELSVSMTAQRKGIGAALLETLVEQARSSGRQAVTLNTFRDIPWNAPFYARHGFVMISDLASHARLAAALDAAVQAGLPRDRRCAMIRSLI